MSALQAVLGDLCITYRIFARFDEALKKRTIPGGFTPQAERGSEEELHIEDWLKFGTPLSNLYATNVYVGLPGGFEQPSRDALISVAQNMPEGAPPLEVTLKTIGSDGAVIEELDFTTTECVASKTSTKFLR